MSLKINIIDFEINIPSNDIANVYFTLNECENVIYSALTINNSIENIICNNINNNELVEGLDITGIFHETQKGILEEEIKNYFHLPSK